MPGIRALGARLIVCAATAALGADAAMAQPQLELERFHESFVGPTGRSGGALGAASVQSSAVGRLLVGLSLGRLAGAVDLSALRVALPSEDGPPRLCVNVTTLDGRYVATSEHRVDGAFAAPAPLNLATEYAEALSAYEGGQLLVRAARAESCGIGQDDTLAPAAGDTEADQLLVSVNIGRGNPKAWLSKDGAPVVDKVSCAKEVEVSRTHECAIPIAGLGGGAYELTIETRRLTGGVIKKSYDVVLP